MPHRELDQRALVRDERTIPQVLVAISLVGAMTSACEAIDRLTGGDDGRASSSADAGAAPVKSAAPTRTVADTGASCGVPCASVERCDSGECVPDCPKGSVYVPATGPNGFPMGRGRPGENDQRHTVVLSKPFCMDATEVTVRAYRSCVEAGDCSVPQLRDINSNYRDEYDRDDHPINMVNWKQAKAYCEAHGKSLPTEAQWEWAASKGEDRTYPWGNDDPSCENGLADFTPGGSPQTDPAGDVGCHGGGTSPVKAHPKGKISYPSGDIFDLGGNVWEWTLDCYLPYPKGRVVDPAPEKHPNQGDGCYVYSLRGGGWNRSKFGLHVHLRAASKWTYRVPGLGFRCVTNAD